MGHDVIVVGGGHNGLVCAAYLARAGLSVLVVERREIAGGAVMTEPLWPGYRVDTCSVLHIAIHTTPIIEELGLAGFGLRYLPADPWAFAPFEDGTALTFYRDLDRTCEALATCCSDADVAAYRQLAGEWIALSRPLFRLFLRPPTGRAVAGAWGRGDLAALRAASAVGDLLESAKSYGRVLEERFESPHLRAALGWLGAQSGTPPDEPAGIGQFVWLAMLHEVGAWHPVGGSGELAAALVRCIEHHGGTVRVGAEVDRIRVTQQRVAGITLRDGEHLDAPIVVGAGHVRTMLLELLPDGHLPPAMRRQLHALRLGPGIGMTVRAGATALPHYPAAPDPVAAAQGMQLYCPSLDYLRRAYHQTALGRPPEEPAVMLMSPSAYDPTIVPPGRQSLYFWAQWHPYRLAGDAGWPEIEEREAARIVAMMTRVAPNLEQIIDPSQLFIQSPRTLDERVGLRGGNVMHLEMSVDQMFGGRPLASLSDYRTPVEGLYLSGASTHPGGGVFGAPGYNSAHTILADRRPARFAGWRDRLQRRAGRGAPPPR